MSLFVLSDPHLSFSADKPMDVFGERWKNHYEKILANWLANVNEGDTVVIPGDVSWGMNLEGAKEDLSFLHSLPGRKIIGRGNHDYWWSTVSKMMRFIEENGFHTLSFLYNNAYLCGNIIVCGTREWMCEFGVKTEDERIILREAERLKLSLDAAVKLKEQSPEAEIVAFTHYPLAFGDFLNRRAVGLLAEYGVKRVYYGHLHGVAENQLMSEISGIIQRLCSCDYLDFCPISVD